MDVDKTDIKEIKRLRKIQLLQSNLIFIFIYISFGIYIELGGSTIVLLGITSAFFWVLLANLVYTFRTGKVIGLKTTKRIQAFDRERYGERRWKRGMIIGFVVLLALSAGATVALFTLDLSDEPLDFPEDSFGLIGAWLGMNAGEIHRIRKVTKETSLKSIDKHEHDSRESL